MYAAKTVYLSAAPETLVARVGGRAASELSVWPTLVKRLNWQIIAVSQQRVKQRIPETVLLSWSPRPSMFILTIVKIKRIVTSSLRKKRWLTTLHFLKITFIISDSALSTNTSPYGAAWPHQFAMSLMHLKLQSSWAPSAQCERERELHFKYEQSLPGTGSSVIVLLNRSFIPLLLD